MLRWVRFGAIAAAVVAMPEGAGAIDLAAAFGELEQAQSVRLSPAGTHVSWIAPAPGRDSVLMVAPADGSAPPTVAARSGNREGFRLQSCDWAGNEHLWCALSNVARQAGASGQMAFQRLLTVKRDGTGLKPLGRPQSARALGYSNFDGDVIYSFRNEPSVLMLIWMPEEDGAGTLVSNNVTGYAVEKVNLATGKRSFVERPSKVAQWYLADATGALRMMAANRDDSDRYDVGKRTYFVRPKGQSNWVEIGRDDFYGRDFAPLGFDESGDWLFVKLRNASGKLAVYKVSADARRQRELVHEDTKADMEALATLGPQNRPVAVSWADEFRYLDPELGKLAGQVAKAVKGRATIAFTGETAARDKLLIYAGSDRDPGRYYLLDKTSRQLRELIAVRGELKDVALGETREVTYPARDGTAIPAYLTVPAGREAKGLPLIVMPHGGPWARDYWGFDFLVQFFAAQGYAVVQPQYRGSTGFGSAWDEKSAIENWRTAIADINDAARALAKQGVADPQRTAIVGWSYGGYAALMGSAMDPGLYKAAVAIAPVADLLKLKRQWLNNESTAERVLKRQFGSSDSNLAEGSPVRRAAAITAPVLLFHGDRDANTLLEQSRDMDAALKAAGKRSELVVYPGLEHSLVDGSVRTDMLRRSAAFLTAAMGGSGGAAVAAGR